MHCDRKFHIVYCDILISVIYLIVISTLQSYNVVAMQYLWFLSTVIEPFFEDICIQTIVTCSPDNRHYKEFKKNGVIQYCMPCWQLNKLKLVGAYMNTQCPNLEAYHDMYCIMIKWLIYRDTKTPPSIKERLGCSSSCS